MTVADAFATLRARIANSRATYVPGTPESYPAAELRGFTVLDAEALIESVKAEIARLEGEVGQQDVLIQHWMTEAEDKQAELARLEVAAATLKDTRDQWRQRGEAAEGKNARLSALIVEQEAEYRKERRAARAEVSRWRDMCALRRQRQKQAEAEAARLRTGIAQQLTPLDVATTHIQIVRRKGDEYTAEERDNVAAIVEGHTTAARSALFALLAEDGAS